MKYLYALKVYCSGYEKPLWASSDLQGQNVDGVHTFETYDMAFEYANTINSDVQIVKLRKNKDNWYICKKSQMIVKPSYQKF